MRLFVLAGFFLLSACRAQDVSNRFFKTTSIAKDIDALRKASLAAKSNKERDLRQRTVQKNQQRMTDASDFNSFISVLTESHLQLGTLQQRKHSALQEVLSENLVPDVVQTIFDVITVILKIIENFFFNILELILDIGTLVSEIVQQFIQIVINFIVKVLVISLQIIVDVINTITFKKPKPSNLSAPSFAGAFGDIEAEIVDPGMRTALHELEMDTMELEDAIGVMVNSTESGIDGGTQESNLALDSSPVDFAIDIVNELTNMIISFVVGGLISALDFVVTTEIDQRIEILIEGVSGILTSILEYKINKLN
jgi:hypothetical protein